MNLRHFLLAFALIGGFHEALSGGLDVDVVCFQGSDSLTYCEVYAGVQRDALIYSKHGEDSLLAVFSLVASLSVSDTIFLSDTLDIEDVADSTLQQGTGSFFPYTFRYLIEPGDYGLEISLLQLEGRSVNQVKERITVPELGMQPGLSEIALGAELSFDDTSSSFSKNGVMFVPNPSSFYGNNLPMLYYYLECYGLHPDTVGADSLTVTRSVLSAASGQPAKQPATRRLKKPGASAVIADGFPAYTLKTGSYFLDIRVQEDGWVEQSARRKFYVYRAEDLTVGSAAELDPELKHALIGSGTDVLNFIDPDSALRIMSYVLSKQDLKRVQNMDKDGKRRWLIEFWNTRNTEDREAANKYFARAAEANRRYDFLNHEGWRTDRGRILMLHGEPTQIDRKYAEAQLPDHEVWHYDSMEGGVYFVFFDRSGFGDLDLVHSTKRGEIYNPNWMQNAPDQNTSNRGLR